MEFENGIVFWATWLAPEKQLWKHFRSLLVGACVLGSIALMLLRHTDTLPETVTMAVCAIPMWVGIVLMLLRVWLQGIERPIYYAEVSAQSLLPCSSFVS